MTTTLHLADTTDVTHWIPKAVAFDLGLAAVSTLVDFTCGCRVVLENGHQHLVRACWEHRHAAPCAHPFTVWAQDGDGPWGERCTKCKRFVRYAGSAE